MSFFPLAAAAYRRLLLVFAFRFGDGKIVEEQWEERHFPPFLDSSVQLGKIVSRPLPYPYGRRDLQRGQLRSLFPPLFLPPPQFIPPFPR